MQYQTARKKNIADKTGGILKTVGINQIISLGGQYLDAVKDSVVASGKGGFNSMIMAFKGKTASEIEMTATEKRLKKDEEQRQKARFDANKKINI